MNLPEDVPCDLSKLIPGPPALALPVAQLNESVVSWLKLHCPPSKLHCASICWASTRTSNKIVNIKYTGPKSSFFIQMTGHQINLSMRTFQQMREKNRTSKRRLLRMERNFPDSRFTIEHTKNKNAFQ